MSAGRPPRVLSEAEIGKVEALAGYMTQDQIGAYLGITGRTFRSIKERQPEVDEAYETGRAKAIAEIAQGLIMEARDGNMTAIIFYLKTQAGWRETIRNEHTGPDGGPVETIVRTIVDPAAT